MRLLVAACATAAGVLLFLLATASADVQGFARRLPLLLGLNAALAAALAALAAWQLLRLARRLRAREFGSRLALRFFLHFALMAVLPGALVYTMSLHFLARSIESWFDVKVEAALAGGLDLGHAAVDQALAELQAKARTMSVRLAEAAPTQLPLLLERLRDQAGVREALVLGPGGRLLAGASADLGQLVPQLPAAQALRQARLQRVYTAVEAQPGGPLSAQVIVSLPAAALGEEPRYLALRQVLPEALARSAAAVEAAYRDYRELALAREDLKRLYMVTLSLALAMALLAALAFAALAAARLSAPLAALAQATQAVARGDFSRRVPVRGRDELGVLAESFNAMTEQLDEARRVVEANRRALEETKAHLENILAHLHAGVLVYDAGLRLTLSNQAAQSMLGDALEEFAVAMRAEFVRRGVGPWQLERAFGQGGRTMLARGAALPGPAGGGFVLVFDDVTELIRAQRATAWAEVAQRLAHEIKNPLTPIRLSAERLRQKLAPRLAAEDADALARATATIVNQVDALASMVDDFRAYARLPVPVLAPLDLNGVVREVLSLYENARVPVTASLAEGLPAVRADAAQMRQLLHNLLQNAQEAVEHVPRPTGAPPPPVHIRTERAGECAHLSVSDQGGGFPEALLERVFEPYVTTKARGTGLGLAIVKRIVDEHGGTIGIDNRPGEGATVSIRLPLATA